jgi:hypothetical protein
MGEPGSLAGRVALFTAVVVAGMAAAGMIGWGPGETAGIVAGGVISVTNFLWLSSTAGRALRSGMRHAEGSPGRVLFWVAGGARLGLVALVLGLAVASGWVGLGGLVVSLTALPVALVAEGLRAARVG